MIKELFSILDSGGVKALSTAILGALALKVIEAVFHWKTADDKARADAAAADRASVRADSQSYVQNLRADNKDLRELVRKAESESRQWRDKYYDALESLLELKHEIEEAEDDPTKSPTDPGIRH